MIRVRCPQSYLLVFFTRLSGVYIVIGSVIVLFCLSTFSTLAQTEVSTESPPAVSESPPAPEPTSEPIPETPPSTVEDTPPPVGEPTPVPVSDTSSADTSSSTEWDSSSPSETPSEITPTEDASSVPSENSNNSSWDSDGVWDIHSNSELPTSSITFIDVGDEILSIIEWDVTQETQEIITLFSGDDVFVEIEVIFSDLDSETDQEIQNEPTLADNTDEDPNVDLVDPSIVPDPAGPLPEPATELPPEDTTPVPESTEASQSTIALLESILEVEELSVRRYEKDIILDESATHTCRADIFRADLDSSDFSRARVTLFQNRKKSLPSFLEIWALPLGIDVVFKSNEDYSYTPGTRETVIEFDITRQAGADVGDFTIPIIYTLQEWNGSSVVCQINILND